MVFEFFFFQTYEAPFIYRIEQKLIRAKNYFARIPAMASFLHRSNNQSNANSYQKNSSSKLKKWTKFLDFKEIYFFINTLIVLNRSK